jgi:hypothetical protein
VTTWVLGSCTSFANRPVNELERAAVVSNQAPLRSTPSLGVTRSPARVTLESDAVETVLDELIDEDLTGNDDGPDFVNPDNIEWSESHGAQCYTSLRYRGFCQGPRRVPKPHGPDAALASELGLGQLRTAMRLLVDAPDPSWVAAAGTNSDENEATDKLMWPIPDGKLLRGFGAPGLRNRRHVHKGIDIYADEGTPFYAVRGGIVAYADNEVRGYGNLMMVVHPDGSVALYSHAHALYLFAGQRIERGQALGEVGITGFAQCTHLHFEYRIKGRPINALGKFVGR